MKVLVAHYSDTGNTEKVARAIYEEVSKKNKADLKKVKETKMEDLERYDLVFLGSPHTHLTYPAWSRNYWVRYLKRLNTSLRAS